MTARPPCAALAPSCAAPVLTSMVSSCRLCCYISRQMLQHSLWEYPLNDHGNSTSTCADLARSLRTKSVFRIRIHRNRNHRVSGIIAGIMEHHLRCLRVPMRSACACLRGTSSVPACAPTCADRVFQQATPNADSTFLHSSLSGPLQRRSYVYDVTWKSWFSLLFCGWCPS